MQDFLDVVDRIYADDRHFIRPLDYDVKSRFQKKNPFFEHATAVAFVAYRDQRPVGRCSAQIDRAWNERYKEHTGFFGFVDTIDDLEVAQALLAKAEDWLRSHGMTRVLGPMSLSSNEEMGCLVDGFDTSPMPLMPHHRSYQGALIERSGFTKAKDLFAWRYVVRPLPKRAQKGFDMIAALPEVTSRYMDKSKITSEVELVMDIFNDAWSENWGYVPLTKRELRKLADELKLIIEPRLTSIVYIGGEPAAFAIALPNVNEHIKYLNGKLSPSGIARLLWGMKMKGTQSARLALLGVRKKFRSQKKYMALSTYMYGNLSKEGQRLGIHWGELSWTLEDNTPVNLGIKMMGGKVYKTYRIYEKIL